MKFLILACLLFASPAWGAISYVTSDVFFEIGGNSAVVGLSSALTGNYVVTVVSIKTTTVSATCADDKSSVWALVGATNNSTNVRVELWKTESLGGNAPTITCSLSGTSDAEISAAAYSGVLSTGPRGTPTTGNDTAPTISENTQDADNFIIAGCATDNNSGISAGTGNLRQSDVSSTTAGIALMDNTAASPGSVANSASMGTPENWACESLELRSVSGNTRRIVAPIVFQ